MIGQRGSGTLLLLPLLQKFTAWIAFASTSLVKCESNPVARCGKHAPLPLWQCFELVKVPYLSQNSEKKAIDRNDW